MEIAVLILSGLCLVLLIVLLVKSPGKKASEELRSSLMRSVEERLTQNELELEASVRGIGESQINAIQSLSQMLQNSQHLAEEKQTIQLRGFEEKTSARLVAFEEKNAARLASFEEKTAAGLAHQHTMVDTLRSGMTQQMEQFRELTGKELTGMDKTLNDDQQKLRSELMAQLDVLQRSVNHQMEQMAESIRALEKTNEGKLEAMRSSMAESMTAMRSENSRKLDEIRGTVDEKLQTTLEKRISESFRTVSEQLEQVYKGIGEMQTIASDVGGLKKVLSGVKTRGILGEVQLGAILEEILSPEQYETNVATIPGSTERVEFAVRLPSREGVTYLPIDSKFPGDRYAQLLDAQESGDREKAEAAYKALETVIRAEAKDIASKYVEVPYTTNFGIMFLPFEGLYAEIVNRGLIEKLQRDYRINVAGPSTMAALLNSLQMGFRTLAIQKRSSEVWEVLGAVKTEFDKFGDVMKKMQGHLNQTSSDLELLLGTRSKAIERKLRNVQRLDDDKVTEVLELDE